MKEFFVEHPNIAIVLGIVLILIIDPLVVLALYLPLRLMKYVSWGVLIAVSKTVQSLISSIVFFQMFLSDVRKEQEKRK